MKRFLALSMSLSLLLGATLPAFAQNSAFPPGTASVPGQTNQGQPVREELKQARTDLQQNRQETKEEVQQARAQFKQQLAQIKDQRKQQLTQQIDERIQTVNQLRTDQMSKALAQLSTILDRIASKEASLQGADTASVSALISDARSAIATSQQAVASQAASSYVIQISSENGLRNDVQTTVKQFHTDLKQTFQTVKTARDAVVAAARALAHARPESVNPDTTASQAATH